MDANHQQNQQISICFGVAERPIKLLLLSYFRRFASQNVVGMCRDLKTNVARIPKDYIQMGDMSMIIDELPKEFLQHDSIYKVPPRTSEAQLRKDPPPLETNENPGPPTFWLLYFDLVAHDKPWDTALVDSFGESSKQLKGTLGEMIMRARMVFNVLKKVNKEFVTLELEVDPANLTLYLVDSRFPNYKHAQRIGMIFRQIPLEEVPEPAPVLV